MSPITPKESVIDQVRELLPRRPLTPTELRVIIERQALRLLELLEIAGPPVPLEEIAIAEPDVIIRREDNMNSSGRTEYRHGLWVISVAAEEPPVRQRFTLAHEYAHVVFHPLVDIVLDALPDMPTEARLEQACEFFAACLLMPRTWLKSAVYGAGIHGVPELARLFGVSWLAMQHRLDNLGITDQPQRRAA